MNNSTFNFVTLMSLVIILLVGCFSSTSDALSTNSRSIAKLPSEFDSGLTFGEAMEMDKPLVVKFYADWCGACRRAAPIFDHVRDQNSDKVNFVMVNVDRDSELSNSFDVKLLPTLYIVNPTTSKRTEIPNNVVYQEEAFAQFVKDQASQYTPDTK